MVNKHKKNLATEVARQNNNNNNNNKSDSSVAETTTSSFCFRKEFVDLVQYHTFLVVNWTDDRLGDFFTVLDNDVFV